MKTFKVIIKRTQISTYYIDAECKEVAESEAYDQAKNDDWSIDKAVYYPLYSEESDLPF